MKVYQGVRLHGNRCEVFVWTTLNPGPLIPLALALHIWNHSPTGFEWGFGGSGPAQLALALLFDATNDQDFAVSFHQDVKRHLVAALPRDVWARTEIQVLESALAVAKTSEAREQAAGYLEMARQRWSKGEEANRGQ